MMELGVFLKDFLFIYYYCLSSKKHILLQIYVHFYMNTEGSYFTFFIKFQ